MANMGGRREVFVDQLLDIEQLLVKVQVQMEGICSTDLSNMSFEGDLKPESQDSNSQPLNRTPEALRILATKQDNVKLINELALLKLRNIIPRQTGPVEEVRSNMNLKRSRPLSPLHVPRIPTILEPSDFKVVVLAPDSASSPRGSHGSTFDVPSSTPAEMLPLKFIRTGDNTKASFQKPSTIFMPTAKLGAVGLPTLDLPIVPASTETSSGMVNTVSSLKKRPSRSRRDRNRLKNTVDVVTPEPVIQRLTPGDTNKIPDDGYLWRKYGNKPIKTASYKKGYFKCRHFKEVQCNATKTVQQSDNDPNTFSVYYRGEHTCCQARIPGGVDGGSQLRGNDLASLADQVNENRKSTDEDKDDDGFDGMEWPRDDEESDCASEEMFPSEGGEDAVESDSALAAVAEEQLAQPASALLSFDMPTIENLSTNSVHSNVSEMSVEATPPWCDSLTTPDYKIKYEDSCPPDVRQEMDQNEILLDFINGGLMGDNAIHDISYWCHDIDAFPSFSADSLEFQ